MTEQERLEEIYEIVMDFNVKQISASDALMKIALLAFDETEFEGE